MKAIGCFALAMTVAVVGFVGLVVWLITRDGDQRALTERVDLVVLRPQEQRDPKLGRGYRFDYAYEHAGRWYGADDWIRDNDWSPGRPLTACIDPDEPRQHVVVLRGEACGQKVINGQARTEATPTAAPQGRG